MTCCSRRFEDCINSGLHLSDDCFLGPKHEPTENQVMQGSIMHVLAVVEYSTFVVGYVSEMRKHAKGIWMANLRQLVVHGADVWMVHVHLVDRSQDVARPELLPMLFNILRPSRS